jgi:hypothetical protein
MLTVYVGRTLLSVAFDFDFDCELGASRSGIKTKSRIKVNGDGQECPSHILSLTSFLAHLFGSPLQRRFEPEPRIVFGFLNQASADGVLSDVFQLCGCPIFRVRCQRWDSTSVSPLGF